MSSDYQPRKAAAIICFFCHRTFSGADFAHRYEWRTGPLPDLDISVYGKDAPGGKLAEARGRLLKVAHHKCYHADKKQRELAAARAADPSAQPPAEGDWRHQEVMEVGELAGEGNRGHRGAGAPG